MTERPGSFDVDPTPTKERLAEFFRGLDAFGLDDDPALAQRDAERRARDVGELLSMVGKRWPADREFVGGFFHPEGFFYLNFNGEVVRDTNSVRGPSAIGRWVR
jgi:hypothetical protein